MGDELTKEDEIRIFTDGARSEFWRLFCQKFEAIRRAAYSALKDPNCENRDFMAGKLSAFDGFLNYPENHVRNLQDILAKGVGK